MRISGSRIVYPGLSQNKLVYAFMVMKEHVSNPYCTAIIVTKAANPHPPCKCSLFFISCSVLLYTAEKWTFYKPTLSFINGVLQGGTVVLHFDEVVRLIKDRLVKRSITRLLVSTMGKVPQMLATALPIEKQLNSYFCLVPSTW